MTGSGVDAVSGGGLIEITATEEKGGLRITVRDNGCGMDGKALEKAQFERIVTTDPHTYHALKNEYPRFGLSKPVYCISTVVVNVRTGVKTVSSSSTRLIASDCAGAGS